MNNQKYWEERQTLNYTSNEKSVIEFHKELKDSFEKARKEIQKVINSFYVRYADNNGMSFTKAQELLSKEEIGELKDYIAQVYATMGDRDINVINKSLRARVTRYEALQKQIEAIIDVLYEVDYKEGGIEKFKEIYKNSYYNTLYNIDIFNGFHTEFSILDIRDIETLIEYPFNGANYSDRLWKQKDHMITKLKENITTMLVQGKNPKTLSSEFAKMFKTKEYEAYRLLHTESSFIIEQGTLAAYKEDGVEEYQILATLDIKTSEICREQDNKVYKIEEYVTGSTAPPFHHFCRTTTVPYYGEYEGTRKARDPLTNRSYDVPDNMKYKEWYDKYIKNNPEALLEEKKWKNKNTDNKQYRKYRKVLGKEAPKSLKEFQNLRYNNLKEWDILKEKYLNTNRYNKIVKESSSLNIKGNPIKDINRISLNDFEFDNKHINLDRHHNVTKEMAQEFINTAKAAYNRWNGEVIVYVSESGCSVVNLKDRKVSTAYKNDDYDDKFKKLMEVLKDD